MSIMDPVDKIIQIQVNTHGNRTDIIGLGESGVLYSWSNKREEQKWTKLLSPPNYIEIKRNLKSRTEVSDG